MEITIVYLVIVLVPALLFLVPAQFFKLRAMVRAREGSSGTLQLLTIALITVLASLAVGVAIGFAILVGPSFFTGVGNDLFWFTMLPAFGVGILVATLVSRLIGAAMINRFAPSSQVP